MKHSIYAILLTLLLFKANLFAMVDVWNPNNPLVVAIKENETTAALDLIKNTPSLVFQRGENNTTPLMAAAKMGNLEVVKALLAAGASAADETDAYNDNALGYYLHYNSEEDVALSELLINATPNLNQTNQWVKGNFLVAAARKGFCKAIELLAHAGFNVDEKGCYYKAPIIFAIYNQQVKTVRLLLKLGADANGRDELSMTPLMNAALVKNTRLIKLLLRYGADRNATTIDPITVIERAPWQLVTTAIISKGTTAYDLFCYFKEPVDLQSREQWAIKQAKQK